MTSVVMPCWFPVVDAEIMNLTEQALESMGDVERVIIDNGSKYGAGWLNQKAHTFLRFPQNKGYTVAINRGILLAEGDLIALANNDIRVSPNWADIAREILADPEIATLHPKMVDYEEPFGLGDVVLKTGHERWCQNSFVVTTRKWLNEMREKESSSVWGVPEPYPGLFDENYGIGGGAEDWEFYLRVRRLGGKTAYTNRISFQHKHSFSLQMLGAERQKIVDQNNEYFKKKWGQSKEEMFEEQCPGQIALDYRGGFI